MRRGRLYTHAKMAITRADVELTSELSHILDAMQALRQLDTSAIPPTAQVIPLENVMRDDVARPSWPVQDVIKNAPATRDQEFLVPPVLD